MRVVMPLFDFSYYNGEEFPFIEGKYALQSFIADEEIPQIKLFSKLDIDYMEMESWALVAENPDTSKYKQEVNLLLLSFRIYKLARVFIKYRLCKEDVNLCSRLNNTMGYILPRESTNLVTTNDLKTINKGFLKMLEMDTISNRTHNALYFMYRGFCSEKMMDAFLLLMIALESLFSNEEHYGATKTICSRVSNFLDSKSGCMYNDIEELYVLRSNITHGRIVVSDEIKGKLQTLYKLQYVIIECMKKILNEDVYTIYKNVKDKENYFTKNPA